VDGTSIKEQDVVGGLKKLADMHHLKLYGEGVPSPIPIAMAHPFSHLSVVFVCLLGESS
jgi:hypothetical protein